MVAQMEKPLTKERVVDAYAEACFRADRTNSLDSEVKRFMIDILDCDPHELESILAVEEFCTDLILGYW